MRELLGPRDLGYSEATRTLGERIGKPEKPDPPVFRFDLRSQAIKQDPFPTLARMRQLGPVIRARLPLFGTVWLTTTYDAANDLLRDHRRFVQSPATAGNRWMGSIVRWLPRTLQPLSTNMLIRDEPDHRRLRHLVDRAFRVRSVEALRPRLEVLADEAANGLARQASRATHGVDLLAHFAPRSRSPSCASSRTSRTSNSQFRGPE